MPEKSGKDGPGFTPPPKAPKASKGDQQPNPEELTDVEELRALVKQREAEVAELMETFRELKAQMAAVDAKLAAKDEKIKFLTEQLQVLKENQALKDEQVQGLRRSLELKDEQIQTLNENLLIKAEQIKTLEADRDAKAEQIQEILAEVQELQGGGASAEEVEQLKAQLEQKERLLEAKNQRISELEEEIRLLNQDLDATDKDIEELHKELEELRSATKGGADVRSWRLTREQVVTIITDVIRRTLHTMTLVVPQITDLEDLRLFDVKAKVAMKVSCRVDPTDSVHGDLLMEYEALDNCSLRNYEGMDRWAISKDNDELFFAAVGTGGDEFLAFHTSDPNHIKLFNPVFMEAWLRARKL
ncbi:MAG: hypothetical protein Kow0069_34980 [Promethearchaeota archaeon]